MILVSCINSYNRKHWLAPSIVNFLKSAGDRMGFVISESCHYSLQHGDRFSVWDDVELVASLRNERELALWLRSYKSY